jgi:hypothetical protein
MRTIDTTAVTATGGNRVTVPGGYNTGSAQQSGQTQQQYTGAETTPGYHQPVQQAPPVTYQQQPDPDYITARIPDTPRFSMAGAGMVIVMLLVIIGIVILLIAKIYIAQLILLDYDDDDYKDKVESIQYNSTIMVAVGTALIPMGLLIGALALEDLGTHVRSGLAIAAGIMLGLTSFLSFL